MLVLPEELESVIVSLEKQQPLPAAALTALAHWRLACGDARRAARWHRWSLETPDPEQVRSELRQLLLLLEQPQLAQRLGGYEGWDGVLLSLENEQISQATQLQKLALNRGIAIQTSMALRVAALWQQRENSKAALELIEPIAERINTSVLCNAVAHLHEQGQAAKTAATWWDRSLKLDPFQPAVLMQRCRNALSLHQPGLAFHMAQTLLELDQHHIVGQELRVEALGRLGARSSLRLALTPLVRQRRARYRQQAQTLQRWWRPRRRRQQHWRMQQPLLALGPPRPLPPQALQGCRQVALLGSRDGFELQGALPQEEHPGEIWNLASPEPLCSQRNLQRLLPTGWNLRSWPEWQPEQHNNLDALVIADPKLPIPPDPPARVLHWTSGWRTLG